MSKTATEMAKAREEFEKAHVRPAQEETVLLSLEATQLAVSTGAALDRVSMLILDQKWFKTEDLSCKDYSLGSVFATKDLALPEHIWVAEGTTAYVVLAVSHTAIPEMLQAAKEVCKQYTRVDLKLVVLTPNEMRLWEGAEKLGITTSSISVTNRQLGLVGGGHRYAWLAESPHDIRHAPNFQRPQKAIIPLLAAGTDPTKMFAKLPKPEDRIAVSILNKHVEDLLKDLRVSDDLVAVAVAPGPHPTLTSWVMIPKPTQEMIKQIETKWFEKENFSIATLQTQQGDLSRCAAIAEVYLSKRARSHDTITKFWATLYFHLAQSMDKYEHRPVAQYESTNKIRLGFVSKGDAQQFIKHALPGLKELGYSFKTEGKKDEFWDNDGDASSVNSRSSIKSWSSTGSRKPAAGDQVVFVDLPEFLPPKQLWELVQQALKCQSIDTSDSTTTFTKLKWSMGSIRKPNWLLTAPGVAKIAGSVLTLTDDDGKELVATVRSKGEWDKAKEDWVAKRPA